MASPAFIVLDIKDGKGRSSPMRFRIADQVIPSGLEAQLSATIALVFGAGLPCIADVFKATLELDFGVSGFAPQANSDVRDKWSWILTDTGGHISRMQWPGANQDKKFISTGGVVLANLTQTDMAAAIAAFATTDLQIKDRETGVTAAYTQGVSTEKSFKRPREGSKR